MKTRISATAHPSATGIGRVSGLVLSINTPIDSNNVSTDKIENV